MEIWTKTSKKEKTFFMVVALLAFYFVATNYIIIDRLKSSPLEVFDSKLMQPKIILPTEEKNSFEKLSEELDNIEKDNIRYITIMMKDKTGEAKATIVFFPGHDIPESHGEIKEKSSMMNEISLGELALQLTSGSNNAFAGWHGPCSNLKYVYQCTGPSNDGAGHIIPAECHCVRK